MTRFLSYFLKIIAAIFVLIIAIFSFWYFGAANYELTGIPILNYHEVDDHFHTCLTMTTHDFDQQMRYLKDNGYHTITPDQLKAYLTQGAALPDKPIMLTFDDGYIDNYTCAYPILKKYNMTGTIFIISGYVGKPGYLSWDNIQQMDKDNMTFGTHTITHRPLSDLNQATVHQELAVPKQILEEKLGHPVDFIAYPEGKYNAMVEQEARSIGYVGAFTVNAGRLFHGDDPYALNRIAVFEGNRSFGHFRLRLVFSTACGYLWKLHRYFDTTLHWTKIAAIIPQP